MPDNARLKYLFQQYLQNSISDKELEELFDCIRQSKQNNILKKQILNIFQEVQPNKEGDQVDWDAMFAKIIKEPDAEESKQHVRVRRLHVWRNIAAAMLILIVGAAGIYLYLNENESVRNQDIAQTEQVKRDILPGGNKAVLTLANGQTIVLDSTGSGLLSMQGKTKVVKVRNGLLKYSKQLAVGSKQLTVKYNTITTPRGGQYQVVLPDGTKVWLNAASSIRFPTVFTGSKRRVEITGEAYFEVVSNAGKPFVVFFSSPSGGDRDGAIEVLGTHFNVNAYENEPAVKTTLLEGSVKVGNTILQPGEQAVLQNGQVNVLKHVDVNDAIAWKNGFFAFNNANLKMVMRSLSRWYDIDVVIKPGVNNAQRFSGRIGRNLTLSQVLNGLKQTSAHFKIEKNRKVVILP